MNLFGSDRIRPGHPDQPWAVWLVPGDEILEQSNRDAALVTAGSYNAAFADQALRSGGRGPHAVVLHHGYAWRAEGGQASGTLSAFDLKVHAGLAELLRAQIRAGHLRPGQLLPQRRELAEQYRVGWRTVKEAVDLLVREGVLVRSDGGVRVSAAPMVEPLPLPGLDLTPVRVAAEEVSPRTHRAKPRHQQLTEILRALIEDESYPPGSRMPSAPQISAQHGFSLDCAQSALRALKAQGLTVTGPHGHTYVAQARSRSAGGSSRAEQASSQTRRAQPVT
ncbi:GntR family transcriptional regulator [Streptomyces sp. NBC_01601]|uniref:GntR family transcriptional regulator n=1 Tax=Streptomyces sp. NBC_01601 TaxID=2975892 RepID=UPI002E27AAA4|nr:GntR family transcriptional regulator [Streptomyces sp. NBC_01601]